MTIARSETERRQKAQDIIHVLQRIQTGNTAHRNIDTLILLITINKKVTHVDTQTVNKMLSQLIDLTVYRND